MPWQMFPVLLQHLLAPTTHLADTPRAPINGKGRAGFGSAKGARFQVGCPLADTWLS